MESNPKLTDEISKIFESSFKNFDKLNINHFEILKCIGTGAYGKVFLVKRKDTEEILAMKTLKKIEMMKKDIKVFHTKNERRIMEMLDHPFLIKLKYAFQNERKIYLLMNYCPGGELFYHINKVGAFNQKAASFYAGQIILALEYLHSQQIIYRE